MLEGGDNPKLLCQDCNEKLFRWFQTRIDWMRILKEMENDVRRTVQHKENAG